MNHPSKTSGISTYDIATRDKIPVIRRLMRAEGDGLALDIGTGTGYTTHAVFGNRPTVCVDLDAANLGYYLHTAVANDWSAPLCVVSPAFALPFKTGAFQFILCSEVLEHLEDDDSAVSEIARMLADDGRAVITVPYTGIGFTGFLELLGIKSVHDFPGPEHHVRPGYDENSLRELIERNGLQVECHAYYLRLFTKLVVDLVSLAHIVYQQLVHGRRAWTWSEVADAESGVAFRFFAAVFPFLLAFSQLDKVLTRFRGFGLVALVTKQCVND